MQIVDTVIAVYNDIHAGSPVAPFPMRQWQFSDSNYSPSILQKILYSQLRDASEEIGRRRKGKRLIVVKLGDMVEGLHHGSKQVSTTRRAEHEAISLELMDRIDEWTGFTDGDLEYFVAGTESHVEESEERIARDRDAQAYIPSDVAGGRDGVYVFPALSIMINGIDCFFAHHGPATGEGANKGNGLRNRVKNLYYEYLENGKSLPRLVIFADKHRKHYERFWRNGKTIDAIISPAWQVKTEFVYKIRPEALSNVGCTCLEIKANGDIIGLDNPFLTIDVEQDRRVFA